MERSADMCTSIIFEDAHIQVFANGSGSRDVLVTFGDMLVQADGYRFAARTIILREGLSHIGFVAKRRNWYPRQSIHEAVAHIGADFALEGRHVTIYGSSMGGYGAIKYSHLLRANTVLAAAPQWSIRPDEVVTFDRRFTSYSTNSAGGEAVTSADVAGRVFLFCDPRHAADMANAVRIMEVCPEHTLIKTHHSSHSASHFLKGTKRFMNLLHLCEHGDTSAVQRFVSAGRRLHPGRPAEILSLSIESKPNWTSKIIHSLLDVADSEKKFGFLLGLSTALLARRKLRAVEYYLTAALEIAPSSTEAMLLMAKLKRFERDSDSEIKWRKAALAIAPKNIFLQKGLETALAELGHTVAGPSPAGSPAN